MTLTRSDESHGVIGVHGRDYDRCHKGASVMQCCHLVDGVQTSDRSVDVDRVAIGQGAEVVADWVLLWKHEHYIHATVVKKFTFTIK